MRLVFSDFCLDTATRQLLRRGKERHVEPKAFELLALLLSRRPEAVAKGEIQDKLWPSTFVSESSLTGLVTQIRQALGDSGGDRARAADMLQIGYRALVAKIRDLGLEGER